MKSSLLVVEDDAVLNSLLTLHLRHRGFDVQSASTAEQMRKLLGVSEPELIILDIKLPDANGIELLPQLVELSSVIVLTAFGSVQNAVDAIKAGASEYLLKPINMDDLDIAVNRVLENLRLRKDNLFLKQQATQHAPRLMVGNSVPLQDVRKLIEAVAPSDMTVLVTGESGVGKELVAREIHESSSRRGHNFVAVDCCSLQDKLFESELFGHERGAFTGADRMKLGLIEMAQHGTLFLDEIGEIDNQIQAKLLRVIETGKFRRVGGTKELSASVRFVAATNRDLQSASAHGEFRSDLYFRLSAFTVYMPALRERREDIAALVEHFIHNHDFSRRISKRVRPSAMRALLAYDWPGNIRELKNIVERAIIISQDSAEIGVEHLSFGKPSAHSGVNLQFEREPSLDEIERDYFHYLMVKHAGQRNRVAEVMGISERNVYRLIKKYGEHASH